MRKFLILLLPLCVCLAQTSNYPTSLDNDRSLFVVADNIQSTLASAMTTGSTTASVGSSTGFAANQIATICDTVTSTGKCTAYEHMLVTAINGNVLTVTRGFAGTSARAHASGKLITILIDAVHQQALKAGVIAIETALGANLSNVNGYNSSRYNFAAQTPGGSLLAGGVGQAITLTPCPSGLAGADTAHYIYLSGGTGTAEATLITGGTCTSGATTGTITVTPANAHSGASGAWTVSSATAGIQEAINAASAAGGGSVTIPAGTFTMRATISVTHGAIHIFGAGGFASDGLTGSVLTRTGDYGNTMTVGSGGGVYDFAITDVQFIHVISYNAGGPTMSNKITVNTDSSHLQIDNSQGSRIEHCSFLDMRYGLTLNGGAHFQIKHNYFRGLWDPKNVAVQQSVASLRLSYASGQVPTNLDIESNYFLDYKSAARNRTINATTFTAAEDVGPQYHILASNFENIHISGGIIQGASIAGIGFINSTTHASLGAEITNVQFDSAGSFDVILDDADTNSPISNVSISNCTFNGEITTGLTAIYTPSHATYPVTVYGLAISGNVFEAYPATPIQLGGAVDVTITGNTIRGYNTQQAYSSDSLNGAAIGLYGATNKVSISGNTIGGGMAGELVGAGAYTNYGITLLGTYLPTSATAVWTSKTNTVISLNNASDLAYLDVTVPFTSGAHYYIATESGSNNAIAGAVTGVPLTAGLRITVQLAHTLQAGANTFNYNAGGALGIKSGRNVANNIGTAYAATGAITLMYDGTRWVDLSQ